MSGWREVTLGDCVVLNDASYSPREAWPIVNYLDTGNITTNRISDIQRLELGKDKIPSRARRKARSGDIVYSTVRPNQRHYGLLKNVPNNFLASTGFAVLRGKERIADTGFIYYFLTQDHIVDYLHSIAETSTSAYPSVKPSDIEQLTLRLPPLPEQRAIAHVLGTLDDKIELNRRMNRTLEEMARSVFKDWFVDFGPTRAKMEGREAYLPSEVWGLFPERVVETEAGEAPEGWGVGVVGDIADSPRRNVSPTDVGEDTPYIGLEHMPRGSIALGKWQYAGKVKSAKSTFKKGDLLFGKLRPYFHKVGIAPLDGICSTDIVVLTPRMSQGSAFLLSHISDNKFIEYTDLTSTGTKMPRTSWKIMSEYRIPIPQSDVLLAFQDVTQPMFDLLVANIHESRVLAGLRDALLPGLVSGELKAGARGARI